MVHHQDTVQYSHTEQGDETDSCRDAERESAQPEGYDTSISDSGTVENTINV